MSFLKFLKQGGYLKVQGFHFASNLPHRSAKYSPVTIIRDYMNLCEMTV
jgi:hypothetical protein